MDIQTSAIRGGLNFSGPIPEEIVAGMVESIRDTARYEILVRIIISILHRYCTKNILFSQIFKYLFF
jgi:hypothetical protein